MDESQKHYVKWKKPNSKAMCWMNPFIWHSGKDWILGTDNRSVVARSWGRGKELISKTEMEFGGDELFHILTVMLAILSYAFVETHRTWHSKGECCYIYISILKKYNWIFFKWALGDWRWKGQRFEFLWRQLWCDVSHFPLGEKVGGASPSPEVQ